MLSLLASPVRAPPDPCIPTPCGPYTNCHVVADRAVCSCIPDYFGDPNLGCKTECTINSDCPLSRACINKKCVDPCVGVCGSEAVCSVVSHNPLCSCPDGFTGDPLIICRPKPGKFVALFSGQYSFFFWEIEQGIDVKWPTLKWLHDLIYIWVWPGYVPLLSRAICMCPCL